MKLIIQQEEIILKDLNDKIQATKESMVPFVNTSKSGTLHERMENNLKENPNLTETLQITKKIWCVPGNIHLEDDYLHDLYLNMMIRESPININPLHRE